MKTKKIIKQNKLCQEVVSITNNIVLIQLLIVSNSRLMVRYEKEKIVLQERIELMKNPNRANIEPKLKYSISLINNMDSYMRDAKVEMKCKLLGSMFPEKITFDGKSWITCKVMCLCINISQSKKKEFNIHHTSQRRSKSFNLCVERFS